MNTKVIEILNKILRKEFNDNQSDMARLMNMKQGTLNKIMRGEVNNPYLHNASSIAKYLKIPLDAVYMDGVIISSSPCTASPICQEICKICESLPDNEKTKILEYTEFIKEQYNNKRGGRVEGIKGGEE